MENKISKNFKDALTSKFAEASSQNPELNTIDGVKEKSDMINSIGKQETNEKWSKKYKKSIDCDNPKGFSQRAHCQGRKKKETKEATGAGSAGGFEAPLFSEPKKMDSMFKDEQPKSKIKGGFVYEGLTESERTYMAKLRDLAKKYANEDSKDTVSKDKIEKVYQELKKQYSIGLKVEKEHKSGDPKQIAIDHLSEDPKYYSKLKKIEATEATGSGSAGSYESPSFLAKSMSPKKWRGKSKTQIPGGKFVEVKKKCKKFPYCNQGDINALKLTENPLVKKVIKTLSKEFNLNESIIRKMIDNEYSK